MESKPCNECPDAVERRTFEGKQYVLVQDMYVSFYTMALMLFSDVPDAKARLDRAMGPMPGVDPEWLTVKVSHIAETISKPLVMGLDAERRKAM